MTDIFTEKYNKWLHICRLNIKGKAMPRESAKRFKSWKWTIDFRNIIGELFSLLYEEENIGLRLNDNSICLFPNICSMSYNSVSHSNFRYNYYYHDK